MLVLAISPVIDEHLAEPTVNHAKRLDAFLFRQNEICAGLLPVLASGFCVLFLSLVGRLALAIFLRVRADTPSAFDVEIATFGVAADYEREENGEVEEAHGAGVVRG